MKNAESDCRRHLHASVWALVTRALLAWTLSGCATVIHGTHQSVGISSTPTGAEVWVDNIKMGDTPLIEQLSRRTSHVVKLVLPGYKPYETTLTRSVSGWVLGNIVIGGLIGLGVDAISGGMYRLTREQITGALSVEQAAVLSGRDPIRVNVVMKPQPGWQLIGQLQRDTNIAQ